MVEVTEYDLEIDGDSKKKRSEWKPKWQSYL
jgi:hypothetical protein